MRVVADAGPLIALAKLDRLGVLEALCTEVWLPVQVVHEVLAKPGGDAQRLQAALSDWLKTAEAETGLPLPLEAYAIGLGAGERAVIAFALGLAKPTWVLMDDANGRALARRAGLEVVGLAGLLLKARERGIINAVAPLLIEAREKGYWVDDGLIATVRQITGEAWKR